jgi:hypothetical protein
VKWVLRFLAFAVAVNVAAAQSKVLMPADVIRGRGRPVRIGVESKPGPDLFENVRATALDKTGHLFVLDAGDNSIRAFTRTGQFIGRTGRAGRGPGDLAFPHAIMHDGDSTLLVMDEINGVSVLRTRADGVQFLRSFGASLRPKAACMFKSQVIVAGYSNERMLHLVNDSGKVLRSFARGFSTDTIERVHAQANRAAVLVACDERNDRIVLAQQAGSGIRAYSLSGELLWSVSLPGYNGTRYQADPHGVSTFWGNDVTESVHVLGDSLLLIQVQRIRRLPGGTDRGRRSAIERLTLTSILIDAITGQMLGSDGSLPLIKAIRGNTLVEVEIDPFPVVSILDFDLRLRP